MVNHSLGENESLDVAKLDHAFSKGEWTPKMSYITKLDREEDYKNGCHHQDKRVWMETLITAIINVSPCFPFLLRDFHTNFAIRWFFPLALAYVRFCYTIKSHKSKSQTELPVRINSTPISQYNCRI